MKVWFRRHFTLFRKSSRSLFLFRQLRRNLFQLLLHFSQDMSLAMLELAAQQMVTVAQACTAERTMWTLLSSARVHAMLPQPA